MIKIITNYGSLVQEVFPDGGVETSKTHNRAQIFQSSRLLRSSSAIGTFGFISFLGCTLSSQTHQTHQNSKILMLVTLTMPWYKLLISTEGT